MGIVVIGAIFVDIKGFPDDIYIPDGRNVGRIEYIHGGVGRNVAEDIANVELRPVFVSLADNTSLAEDVLKKLNNHKVNTTYVRRVDDGMGSWLAVFDNNGDLAGSISQRPDMLPLADLLDEKGDEIFAAADSIVIEVDLDKEIVKRALRLAEKYRKKIYAVVANMSIAAQRRDFLQKFDCFICNRQEAGILFADDYTEYTPEELSQVISEKVIRAQIPSMIVTLGEQGAVFADRSGYKGVCKARNVKVKDTTGAGDAFCAGTVIGLTHGKNMREAVDIGSYLAASVITTSENVCPRFLPRELGLDIDVPEDD
jgi:pseudouridine kinase